MGDTRQHLAAAVPFSGLWIAHIGGGVDHRFRDHFLIVAGEKRTKDGASFVSLGFEPDKQMQSVQREACRRETFSRPPLERAQQHCTDRPLEGTLNALNI